MAGGPSTPALAAAVSSAGGLGFLAGAYRPVEKLREDVAAVRRLTERPFGLNLFWIEETPVDEAALAAFAELLAPEAARLGVAPGEPRFENDALEAKLELAVAERVPVVSFTFACPSREAVERLHGAGSAVWAMVTEVEEARAAAAAGVDALVVQGVEAGGHRGSFADEDGVGETGLLALLRLVARAVDLPLVAAGGIGDGAGVAAVLAAGARAAQIGTAFLRCPEAGTSAPHREALARPGRTALTRAFSGRRARAIENGWTRRHAGAPSAYPQLQHVTGPLRAAARAAADAEATALWAGQAFPLAEELPAGELVRRLGADARAALEDARRRLGRG